MTTLGIITIAAAFLIGAGIGWLIMKLAMKYRAQNIIKEAEAEAEVIKKDKILQAKEKFLQIKAEHEKQAAARNN
ncbi:MAG: ribonuclease Y, partial [Odoribacter sp.]|nr:ribonuclease Y [Odoribacter sp.]